MIRGGNTVNFATFILSTGRCGTQWIAKSLGEAFPDQFDVEHEPLHNGYAPREILAANVSPNLPNRHSPAAAAHLDQIEERLESGSYIECGHPVWSTIPYLADRFRGRVRIIHLTRHPVTTSFSWLTHGAFQDPILPNLPTKTMLTPFDEGITFNEYREKWETLSPFEKCLYYWSEVNAFALDLETRIDAPWLRLQYEDMFEPDGLKGLLDFLELPHRSGISDQQDKVVDRYRYLSTVWDDPRVIKMHPAAIAIANDLGYDPYDIDEVGLRKRYLGIG